MSSYERMPDTLGEEIWQGRHRSGLHVLLNPRPGFSRTAVQLSAHFGSLDMDLRTSDATLLPAGTAHFLEHQLFQNEEEGDLSLVLAERGASSNASTDWFRTTYEMGCSDDAASNLALLCRRVFHPHFVESSVERERAIIAQELAMGEDDPGWMEFRRALEAMYPGHAVCTDVVGTLDSLRRIDSPLLAIAHRRFYRPDNMVLVASGGFDTEALRSVLDEVLPTPRVGELLPTRSAERMPPASAAPLEPLRFAIARPRVFVAWRDTVSEETTEQSVRRRLVARLLLDCLFSTSARVHMELYERGIVDDSFHASYTGEHGFGFTSLGGETEDPREFVAAMDELFAQLRANGVPREEFEHCRRLGRALYVRSLDGIGSTASALTAAAIAGMRPHRWLEMWESLQAEELDECLHRHLLPEHRCEVVLVPTSEGAGG